MEKIFAQDLVGSIDNPLAATGYNGLGGIGLFITNILRVFFVVAGILALFNFITAGFSFMNAGGDSKAVGKAWDKIWQSLLGLVIIVGSFAVASIFGQLIFGRADFILNPQIYGPTN
jgi:hypothetical protein